MNFTLGYTCSIEKKFFNIKGKKFPNKTKAKNWVRNNKHFYWASEWFLKDASGKREKI